MEIGICKDKTHYRNHLQTMTTLEYMQAQQAVGFDQMFQNQKMIYSEQIKSRLQNEAWFNQFDSKQQQVLTELGVSRLNQDYMIKSLDKVNTNVDLHLKLQLGSQKLKVKILKLLIFKRYSGLQKSI